MSDKIKIINPETIIDIKVSGLFYKRIQALLFKVLGEYPEQEQLKALQRIAKGKLSSEKDSYIETLLSLVKEIETNADKQNKTSEMEKDVFMKDLEDASKKFTQESPQDDSPES